MRITLQINYKSIELLEQNIMTLLLCTFLLAFSVSTIITPIVRKIAFKYGACAKTNHRTVHNGIMPQLGGISVFVAFLIGMLVTIFLTGNEFAPLKREIIVFLIGACLILFLGIYDDIKGADCIKKFSIQILAALIVIIFGYKISFIVNPFGPPIYLGIFSIPFTLLWIVGITNAFNLIDGLDGLAAGISLGASLIMLSIALYFGNIQSAFPSAILAGAIGGFLIFNFNPAKIFLGDSGSLLIGFLLACFSINGTFRDDSAIALYIPVIVLGVPIIDTILAIIRRARKGVHLFVADKEHIHHRLLNLGLNHRQAVLFLYAVSIFWGMIGFSVYILNNRYSLIFLLLMFITILIGLKKLGFTKYFFIRSSSIKTK